MLLKTLSKVSIALGAMLLLSLFSSSCSRVKKEKVVVKGSTTVLPITQKTAEEYMKIKKVSISIEGSGSGNGIKAIIDGNCDIANSSREMNEKEKKMAKAKKVNVREIVCAYDMIVPIVHPSNSIKNISMDQLKGIYDGSIKYWKELGGKDERIVVISRDTSSGTYEVWHKIVMKKADVRSDALLQASNGAINTAVAENHKAIGYIGFGYVNKLIKTLTVNRVVGNIENGKSGKYPIFRKLYMYVNKDKLYKEAEGFIIFILSIEGQKLVKEKGFIPL